MTTTALENQALEFLVPTYGLDMGSSQRLRELRMESLGRLHRKENLKRDILQTRLALIQALLKLKSLKS